MCRRMMIGCMQDPVAGILTVVALGVMEAALRCTMVQRDELWDLWTSESRAEAGPNPGWTPNHKSKVNSRNSSLLRRVDRRTAADAC